MRTGRRGGESRAILERIEIVESIDGIECVDSADQFDSLDSPPSILRPAADDEGKNHVNDDEPGTIHNRQFPLVPASCPP